MHVVHTRWPSFVQYYKRPRNNSNGDYSFVEQWNRGNHARVAPTFPRERRRSVHGADRCWRSRPGGNTEVGPKRRSGRPQSVSGLIVSKPKVGQTALEEVGRIGTGKSASVYWRLGRGPIRHCGPIDRTSMGARRSCPCLSTVASFFRRPSEKRTGTKIFSPFLSSRCSLKSRGPWSRFPRQPENFRRVSMTLREVLREFSELFMCTGPAC